MPRRRSNRRRSTGRRTTTRRRSSRPRFRGNINRGVQVEAQAAAAGPVTGMRKLAGASSVQISFGRDVGNSDKPVIVCAAQGRGRHAAVECATGRNPRVAMASALRKLAGKIEGRTGVFAGLSGGKRRRRRR
jgi:hypothetical protein